MKTDQDLLKEYMEAGDTQNAARFLRFLIGSDRGMERRTSNKEAGAKKSGHWQITRSLAKDALTAGELDDHSQLLIHLKLAFQEQEGEDAEQRRDRALETFEALVDAAKGMLKSEVRYFFQGVDGAADYALNIMENFDRFPTKREVRCWVEENTNFRSKEDAEWTKIYKAAHLGFLPKRGSKVA
jgi:hypothetical protein